MSRAPLLLLLGLGLAGCEEGPGSFGELHPDLAVDVQTVTFGELYVGLRRSLEIELRNDGNAATRVVAEIQGDHPAAFSVTNKVTVNAGGVLRLEVVFQPEVRGERRGLLVIAHTGESRSPILVTLSGKGKDTPDCDDGAYCTEDWFDLETGSCRHRDRVGLCDDNNACTELDHCAEGRCVGHSIDCHDLTDCTLDTCDPGQGCVFVPQHQQCADQDPCTEDTCVPLVGCVNAPLPEGSLCDLPSCAELAVCVGGACLRGPAPDGFPCEDGDVCTSPDTCQDGACASGPGEPFGAFGPLELPPTAPQVGPPTRVLAVAPAADQSLYIVYEAMAGLPFQGVPDAGVAGDAGVAEDGAASDVDVATDGLAPSDGPERDAGLDATRDDAVAPCDTTWGSPPLVRVVRLSAGGQILSDDTVTSGHLARAALREGRLYTATLQIAGDEPCPMRWLVSVMRFELPLDPGAPPIELQLPVPDDAPGPWLLDLAASDHQVAVALALNQVEQRPTPRVDAGDAPDDVPLDAAGDAGAEGDTDAAAPPLLDRVWAARLSLLSPELVQEEQETIELHRGDAAAGTIPPAVATIELGYRGEALDLGYLASGDHVGGACADLSSQQQAVLLPDVNLAPPRRIVLQAREVMGASQVPATYPQGAVWTRVWNAFSADAPDAGELDGSEPVCLAHDRVRLYSADEASSLAWTTVLSQDGQDLTAVAAVGVLGQLGALLLRQDGSAEIRVPPAGLVPEIQYDVSIPAFLQRRWVPVQRPATRVYGDSLFVGGVSEALPTTECVNGCGPPGSDPLLMTRRVLVAGAGCGIGVPVP